MSFHSQRPAAAARLGLLMVLAATALCGAPSAQAATGAASTPATTSTVPVPASAQVPPAATAKAPSAPATGGVAAAPAATTPQSATPAAPTTSSTPVAPPAAASTTTAAPGAHATRSSGLSTPAIALAALGALLALACLAWAIARAQAYEPHWARSLRHSLAEGGFRASATWAEFSDWARLGK